MNIQATKSELRRAMLSYYRLLDSRDMSCGANMAAHIVPAIGKEAAKANQLARLLQKHDPAFPKNWSPLPEGN